jgi:transposase
MTEHSKGRDIAVLGIDLAKRSFHVYGVDDQGQRVVSKKLSRARLTEFMVKLPPCLVAMEACGSAHHWGRTFESYGHQVRLIAPQFVKPYVKTNKNDAADAEAIAEAVQRPRMRFVALKTVEQQDLQAIHRLRSLVVARRTAQVNQVRGLLLEFGLDIPQGRAALMRRLPELLEDGENGLSERFRVELREILEELRHLDERVTAYDQRITAIAKADKRAQRLMTIPGIGSLTATALLAAVGNDPGVFSHGRGLAAWLGLVPRQASTGGRERLLGISKHGDIYLRELLIHGARAVLRWVERKTDRTSRWATALKARRHSNVATVAMANKMARIAYAVLMTGEEYDPERGAARPAAAAA